MTKLAFVTDNHWDAHSRLQETIRVHRFIAEDAAARGCNGTLLGGDLFERKSVPEDRNAAAEWLIEMARFGPVVGVYGNHEAPGDAALMNLLDAVHPIRIHAAPAVDRIGDAVIACIPWPRKHHLLAQMGGASVEDGSAVAVQCLRQIFLGLGTEMDELAGPRIALAHLMLDGSKTDHDQPIVGADMAVSLADLGLLRADLYAVGHVHAQQTFRIGAADCFYGGAPRHNNFGEPGPKGYVVIEHDGERIVGWERVATPCTPMAHFDAEWSDEGAMPGLAMARSGLDRARGAECRLRYRVPADRRDVARADAEELRVELIKEAGAVSVKIEEQVVTTTRARAPEIAAEPSLRGKLTALWRARGEDLPETRVARVLEKVSSLEQEIADAS